MPSPKKVCPTCAGPMHPKATQCRKCKPTYQRTEDHRLRMIAATKGKPKPWLRGRRRPRHAEMMREYWTPERREAKNQSMLRLNPAARYHGLSARAAKAFVRAVGHCQQCGHDGSISRLGVHHLDRDKRNQRRENLQVLCHRCHMREHACAGETGWQRYHAKRKTNPD